MRLTPSERDRLLIFTVAELARARRARGLRLNVPEATALIADTVCEAARDGSRLAEARRAGAAEAAKLSEELQRQHSAQTARSARLDDTEARLDGRENRLDQRATEIQNQADELSALKDDLDDRARRLELERATLAAAASTSCSSGGAAASTA